MSQSEGTAPPGGGARNRRNYFSDKEGMLHAQENIMGRMSLLINSTNLEFWLSSTLLALCMLNCSQMQVQLLIAMVNGVGSASNTSAPVSSVRLPHSLFNLHDGWAAKLY